MASFISGAIPSQMLRQARYLYHECSYSRLLGVTGKLIKNNFSGQAQIANVSNTGKDVLNQIEKRLLADTNTKHLFLGTCRYYHHKIYDRFVIVDLGDQLNSSSLDVSPQCLIDSALPRNDIEELKKTVPKLTRCASFSFGEVDGYFDQPWQFGYTLQPVFAVFTTLGIQFVIQTMANDKIMFIQKGACRGQSISLADVKSVRIEVSDDPWSSRYLILKMKDSDTSKEIIEDSRIDLNAESKRDLATLMIETEWLVTVAAHLSIAATTAANRKVPLQLADVLTSRGNPWVQMRNTAWISDSNTT